MLFNQVKDDDRALSLGSLTIPLTRLLATPELTMDQWFQLENSASASRIYVKIVLRVGISHVDVDLSPVLARTNPFEVSVWKTLKSYPLPKGRFGLRLPMALCVFVIHGSCWT